jgi:hypothetical protein
MRDAATDQQFACFAAMTPQQRVSLGMHWSAVGIALRRERIRRAFPTADAQGLRWAMAREVLGYPSGTEPIP